MSHLRKTSRRWGIWKAIRDVAYERETFCLDDVLAKAYMTREQARKACEQLARRGQLKRIRSAISGHPSKKGHHSPGIYSKP